MPIILSSCIDMGHKVETSVLVAKDMKIAYIKAWCLTCPKSEAYRIPENELRTFIEDNNILVLNGNPSNRR